MAAEKYAAKHSASLQVENVRFLKLSTIFRHVGMSNIGWTLSVGFKWGRYGFRAGRRSVCRRLKGRAPGRFCPFMGRGRCGATSRGGRPLLFGPPDSAPAGGTKTDAPKAAMRPGQGDVQRGPIGRRIARPGKLPGGAAIYRLTGARAAARWAIRGFAVASRRYD